MKYNDLLNVCAKVFGTDRPADIARELDITPQAINNWEIRDQVPYKYTKKLKAIINEKNQPLEANYLHVQVRTKHHLIMDQIPLRTL